MIYILKKYQVFLYLLPVFFVLHSFTENYNLVPVKDAVWLTLFYVGCTLVVTLICWLFYRNFIKASLAAFFLMSIYFFFGTVHDTLKDLFPGSFITKYVFLLPFLLLFSFLVIFLIKKSKSKFKQLAIYLNALFIILLIFEIFILSKKTRAYKSIAVSLNSEFIKCDSCATPDIYLIVADGYTSNTALKEIFKFDNNGFETELKNRNFNVINNSYANYNFTIYSMASMFTLNYLNEIKNLSDNINNQIICTKAINDNQTIPFLKKLGYTFYNFSDINFPEHPAATTPTFLLGNTVTITSQTLSGRIYKDLWYHLATNLKLKKIVAQFANKQLSNNNHNYEQTKKTVTNESGSPKFVYTHLIMPHNPYYFDKDGKAVSIEKILEYTGTDRSAFIEYLQYSNKKYLELIDFINANSKNPPVIILMGDHGFRDFNDNTEEKYHFMNLSAFKLPNANYSGFYDSSSSINQMRIFFNNQFNQKFPLLKDSTVFIIQ